MTFGSGCASKLFLAFLLADIFSQQCRSQVLDQDTHWIATIQVLVRDSRELPISGLGAADFILSEGGLRDAVLEVRSLSPEVMTAAHPTSSKDLDSSNPQASQGEPAQMQTWVLIVLAPMSASGRSSALASVTRLLKKPSIDQRRIAMLDDEGEFIAFGQNETALRSRLKILATRVSSPQFIGGPWTAKANRAIEELAVRPGRHCIVFASDFESNVSYPEARNPYLLRIGPSAFIGAAVHAQAAMYTVQGSGPGTVVPLGDAASGTQYHGSGQQVAETLMMQTVSLGNTRSDFIYAADETGGLAALDVQDAFVKIAADATGYYQITFQPRLEEADGAWHPIAISVRAQGARIRGPKYYLAPTQESRKRIPAAMMAALKQGTNSSGLEITAYVWLFPDGGGVHTGVMAADLPLSAISEIRDDSSRLQIFAQLVDDSMGRVVGSWLSERDWNAERGRANTVHWQREVSLYPGSYTLRVMTMDSASGKIGTRAYSFLVNPLTGPAVRFSSVVIADRCLEEGESEGRSNLLDPVFLDGCRLAPSASGLFSIDQNPRVLVRIYTPNEKIAALITKQWKASVVLETGQAVPLAITSPEVRGLVVSGQLILRELGIKPGTHQIKVVFEVPTDDGRKHPIELNSEFSVTP